MQKVKNLLALSQVTILLCSGSGAIHGGTASVKRTPFGVMPGGKTVYEFVLTNRAGVCVAVITYGATLRKVSVPDRNGRHAIVTLYLDSLSDYLKGHPLLGSTVGRFANRIGGAQFVLDGVRYHLTKNAGPNHIHGGRKGFQKVLWEAQPFQKHDCVGVRLSHVSPGGHEGYPGTVRATVTYTLNDVTTLTMQYTATTDKPTIVNLTNHAYWNLKGAGNGTVLTHRLMIRAERYLVTDSRKVPTGKLAPVAGTLLDFRTAERIGARLHLLPERNYDHCYVLTKELANSCDLAAHLIEPESGRAMEVYTTQPGLQLYTAKFLSRRFAAGGKPYGPYYGVCLEAQNFPNSPNIPSFPSPVLRPNQVYRHRTVHRFLVLATDQ